MCCSPTAAACYNTDCHRHTFLLHPLGQVVQGAASVVRVHDQSFCRPDGQVKISATGYQSVIEGSAHFALNCISIIVQGVGSMPLQNVWLHYLDKARTYNAGAFGCNT